MKLYLDFETRSEIDLPACGTYVYADHPTTRVLCAAFAVEDGPVQTLINGDRALHRGTVLSTGFGGMLVDPNVKIVARNAEFERNILRGVLGLDLPPSKFICTAAQSARAGLPRSLEASGAVLGTSEQKDAATGRRVIMKLCKPRRPSKDNRDKFWEPHTAPDDYEALYAYCAQDVRTDRGIHKALPPIGEQEQMIWELTVRMNDRGVKVDLESIPLLMAAAAVETERLGKRFYELTGVAHNSVVAAAAALGVADLTKATVRQALAEPGDEYDAHRREALEIRQKIAKSSLAKLQAFLDRTSADGRLRGSLVYAGAERTARWSGTGVQLQNLSRGLGEETNAAFEALREGRFAEYAGDAVLDTCSGMIRGLLMDGETA